MTRTNPSEALERLATTLNYPRREPISINELAGKTDLSWATTKKYVQLLEVLGRIAPKISVDENGVTPVEIGDNLNGIKDQKDIQLVIYLFIHGKIEGSPTAELILDDHSDVLSQYEETIEELEQIGWLETTDDSIALTPEGVSIAGQAHSRIRNRNLGPFPKRGKVQVSGKGERVHKSNTREQTSDTDWVKEFDGAEWKDQKADPVIG